MSVKGTDMRPCTQVGADGNCFFRALCDQRWGSDSAEEDHMDLRKQTIAYMVGRCRLTPG